MWKKQTIGGTVKAIPIAGKALVKHALNCIAWGLVCGLIFGLILGKSEKPYFEKYARYENLKTDHTACYQDKNSWRCIRGNLYDKLIGNHPN